MATSVTFDTGDVSSQPPSASDLSLFDFETLMRNEGSPMEDTPPFMADDKRFVDFNEETEHARQKMRSTSEDREMRDTTLEAPPYSPLTVADVNGEEEQMLGENAQTDFKPPMSVDELHPHGFGVATSASEAEKNVFGDAGQAVGVAEPQTAFAGEATGRFNASDGGLDGPMSPPKSDKTQSPLLVERIMQAVKKSDKNKSKIRDVAVILDPDDLSKTLLLSSNDLARLPGVFEKDLFDLDQDIGDLQYIHVLRQTDDMPFLHSLGANCTLAVFEGQRSSIYSPTAKVVSTDKPIKQEDDTGVSATKEAQRGTDGDGPPNWAKMYKIFLRSVEAGTTKNPFDSDATKAVKQLKAVLAIAAKYSEAAMLHSAFQTGLLAWIGGNSLYPAIKEDPVSWLEIGITMRNENTFKEAFVHCAGLVGSFPTDSASDADRSIRDVIDGKATALRKLRHKIELRLLYGLTLTAEVPAGPGHRAKAFVSIECQPISWIVSQLYSDWIREHLQYLSGDEDDDDEPAQWEELVETANIKTTATCDHRGKGPQACLTLGGFYRLLGKADDAYLPFGQVIKLLKAWDKTFGEGKNPAIVRDALQTLKGKAAAIVEPLVQSKLQFAGRDELEYLTCVEVGREDIPWEVKDGGVKDEDDEDDEMEW